MAGPELLMEQEAAFLRGLERARSVSLRDGHLILQDETGQSALEFER
jgi:heat shock protein HslJ